MASLNPLTREVVFKIVFYGPGLGGKTTTLQHIHAASKPEHRGKMVSLATPMDRTLYFDFLPLRMPLLNGMHVRLQLFTVPGQVYFGATRKLVLTGADGVVFVADSQVGRQDANQESLEDLVMNLAENNLSLLSLPHTFHWNKRDLSDIVPIQDLDRTLNRQGAPSIGTVATSGDGVFTGLERITRLVFEAYQAELPKPEAASSNRASPDRGPIEETTIEDALRGLAEESDEVTRAVDRQLGVGEGSACVESRVDACVAADLIAGVDPEPDSAPADPEPGGLAEQLARVGEYRLARCTEAGHAGAAQRRPACDPRGGDRAGRCPRAATDSSAVAAIVFVRPALGGWRPRCRTSGGDVPGLRRPGACDSRVRHPREPTRLVGGRARGQRRRPA